MGVLLKLRVLGWRSHGSEFGQILCERLTRGIRLKSLRAPGLWFRDAGSRPPALRAKPELYAQRHKVGIG